MDFYVHICLSMCIYVSPIRDVKLLRTGKSAVVKNSHFGEILLSMDLSTQAEYAPVLWFAV